MHLIFMAVAVAENVTKTGSVVEAGTEWNWFQMFLGFLVGVVGIKLIEILLGSTPMLQAAILKAQAEVNENSILSQIQADDAVLKIIHDAIPDVIGAAADKLKKAFKDGRLEGGELNGMALDLWDAAKPHVEGGKNDYLKTSSFNDGKVVAKMILNRVMKRKREGLA